MRWLAALFVGVIVCLALSAAGVPTDAASPVPTHVKLYLPEQIKNGDLAPSVTPTAVPIATGVPATKTATPPPTATVSNRDATIFLFISGMFSDSTKDDFGGVKTKLVARGYSTSQFASYSYRGGINAYSCTDTFQSYDLDTYWLAQRVADFPGKRLVVIGHSLGGLIAWSALDTQTPRVVGVVTVDSPLLGMGPGKIDFAENWWFCSAPSRQALADTPIGIYLAGLQYISNLMNVRVAAAGNGAARGVLTRSLGNDYDCIYWPLNCLVPGFSNDEYTQFVTYTDFHFQDVKLWPPASHTAVLIDYPDYVAYYADVAARGS